MLSGFVLLKEPNVTTNQEMNGLPDAKRSRVASTPQSKKSKGRSWQQECAREAVDALGLEPDDIRSTSMGANGVDLVLSPAAKKKWDVAVECKNVNRLNLMQTVKQAIDNAVGKFKHWAVLAKIGRLKLAIIPVNYFWELVGRKGMDAMKPEDGDIVIKSRMVTDYFRAVHKDDGSVEYIHIKTDGGHSEYER